MTEMKELAQIVPELNWNWECPFPHEEKKWEEYDNDFWGDGEGLGEKMESGAQTIINTEMGGGKKIEPVEYPKLTSKSDKGDFPIEIKSDSTTSHYPLTCAAHHLIPAQASLRESDIVKYLYKNPAVFKLHNEVDTRNDGKLVANVGYDVNGTQNGIWLPGPYALRTTEPPRDRTKSRGKQRNLSMVKWMQSTEQMQVVEMEEIELTLYELYAVSSMKEVKAQYHDAHPDYSKFVNQILNAIAIETKKFATGGLCDKCPKRKEDDKLPPPYGLVSRLNRISTILAEYLKLKGNPASWKHPVFTSRLSVRYMEDHEAFDEKLG